MAAITCLSDKVGVVPCDGESPYLHHISDLEGLSLESIAASMPGEKWVSAKQAVLDLVALAAKDIFRLVRLQLSARGVQMQTTVDKAAFGYWLEKTQPGFVPGDGGLYVQKNPLFQPDTQPIRVNFVYLKSPNNTVNIPLKIKDAAGAVLWSATVPALSAGVELEVPVGQDFYESSIRIVIDGADMQGYYADTSYGDVCCGLPPLSSPYSTDRSAFAVNAIEGGAIGGFKAPGMRVHLELPCLENLFCQYSDRLAYALLFAAGVKILKEWEQSPRLNFFTLKKDFPEKKIPEWENERDLAIELEIPGIIDDLSTCYPRCFKCRQPFGTIPALP